MNPMNTLRSLKAPAESILTAFGFIKIALILYSVLVAPQLPPSVSKYFQHPLVQVIIFALIAYTATKDIAIALLIAIAFFLSFNAYTKSAISNLNSNTTKLFVATNKVDDMSSVITMGDCKIPSEEPQDCTRPQHYKLGDVMGHDQDMTVEYGLKKDSDRITSEISDAALLDPYMASMVPVKDMPGYSF